MKEKRKGSLRIWWINQITKEKYTVHVESVDDAVVCLIVSVNDLFGPKGNTLDFPNDCGLEILEEGGWLEWKERGTGKNIYEWANRVNS